MDHSIEVDEYHRLSVAYRDLAKLPANFQGCSSQLVSLDASHNELSTLEVLENCTKLETLILDNNALSSSCGIPHLPSLRYLSVNSNNIADLVTFVDTIKKNCPKLRWLSMLNNEACFYYFNTCTAAKYAQYRLYVIAQIKTLKVLDNTHITDDERCKAQAEGLKPSTEDCLCKKQPGDLHIQLSANNGMRNGDLLLLSARRGALDNMRRCHAGWDVLSDGSNVVRLRSHCRALKLANSEAEGQSRERRDAWCREIQLQQSRALSRAH
eukprot:CAMPEP_0174378002 /NCGR_PEP_ID=MMETSP0811_2-20130205/121783_1 /TAXON_ID=73025 ORGANISM="Eutreptiella gymnastica-like, Strain CCMP1594" /NCGR_SAMPLE_ID=MMETSP0811_2 /ASSEMBLY_ACC=CAM_ASM_000667 /LENGTH=267 /DNA_ID=CAMNT_0015530117 /DNA_START=16 /DNA_END=819 /DNA_ORIENTATION=+